MIPGVISKAVTTHWPYLIAGIPAVWRLGHSVKEEGFGSITRYWRSASLAYVGSLYSLHIAWLALTGNWLLTPSLRTSTFLVVLSVALLLYFLARSFDETDKGRKLRTSLEEAIWGNSTIRHPLQAPCDGFESLRGLMQDGAELSDREVRELFHENDAKVKACLKSLELSDHNEAQILRASVECQELLEKSDWEDQDRSRCQDVLARYHGSLQAILAVTESGRVGNSTN